MFVLAVGDKDPGAEEKACVHPVAGYRRVWRCIRE
jgi:hypothetical protein